MRTRRLATEFRSAIKAADLRALIEERHRFMADQTLDWGLPWTWTRASTSVAVHILRTLFRQDVP